MIANWNKIINSVSLADAKVDNRVKDSIKKADYNRDSKVEVVSKPSIGHRVSQVRQANNIDPVRSKYLKAKSKAQVDEIRDVLLKIINS